MMRYKFNPYERAVGLFLIFTIVGSFLTGVGVAVKKSWFEDKVSYSAFVPSASNMREGSAVLMAGLKVGWIDKIELDRNQSVKVTFQIFKKYQGNITQGTEVKFVRPFIIGDKVLTLVQGPVSGQMVMAGEVLPTAESLDLMDIVSGSKAQAMVARVDNIIENLDATLALTRDLAHQAGDKKKLQKTLDNVAYVSSEVRKVLPHLTSKTPEVTAQLMKTIDNLTAITTGFKEIQPEGSKRTIELLNESVVLMRAMQKNFFLKGNVKEVKEEMASTVQNETKERAPASTGE